MVIHKYNCNYASRLNLAGIIFNGIWREVFTGLFPFPLLKRNLFLVSVLIYIYKDYARFWLHIRVFYDFYY